LKLLKEKIEEREAVRENEKELEGKEFAKS